MAYQMVATAVTLNELEGHSPLLDVFKCNPWNICAAFCTISTDSVLAWFLCIGKASCQQFSHKTAIIFQLTQPVARFLCTAELLVAFSRRYSITQMLLQMRISSFDTIVINSRYKFDAVWSHSNNSVISHLCTLGLQKFILTLLIRIILGFRSIFRPPGPAAAGRNTKVILKHHYS